MRLTKRKIETGDKMKALVVDDSLLGRKTIIQALRIVGNIEIDEAKDGQEAVDMVSSGHYEIIMMDWNMPVMDGIHAIQKIRETNKEIPIIMVTGLGDESHVREALQMGANNFIIKPFKPDSAASLIREMMKSTN